MSSKAALLSCACLTVAFGASLEIRDVYGKPQQPLRVSGMAEVLFFVMTDCPVSNTYAPEIQHICADYGTKGVACSLVYEDVQVDAAGARHHMDEYRYKDMPAIIDAGRRIAEAVKATTTPQAVVLDKAGKVRYSGRIDNFYAALGKPRRQATEHDLRDALDAVLAGRAVANPETKALGCYIPPKDLLKK